MLFSRFNNLDTNLHFDQRISANINTLSKKIEFDISNATLQRKRQSSNQASASGVQGSFDDDDDDFLFSSLGITEDELYNGGARSKVAKRVGEADFSTSSASQQQQRQRDVQQLKRDEANQRLKSQNEVISKSLLINYGTLERPSLNYFLGSVLNLLLELALSIVVEQRSPIMYSFESLDSGRYLDFVRALFDSTGSCLKMCSSRFHVSETSITTSTPPIHFAAAIVSKRYDLLLLTTRTLDRLLDLLQGILVYSHSENRSSSIVSILESTFTSAGQRNLPFDFPRTSSNPSSNNLHSPVLWNMTPFVSLAFELRRLTIVSTMETTNNRQKYNSSLLKSLVNSNNRQIFLRRRLLEAMQSTSSILELIHSQARDPVEEIFNAIRSLYSFSQSSNDAPYVAKLMNAIGSLAFSVIGQWNPLMEMIRQSTHGNTGSNSIGDAIRLVSAIVQYGRVLDILSLFINTVIIGVASTGMQSRFDPRWKMNFDLRQQILPMLTLLFQEMENNDLKSLTIETSATTLTSSAELSPRIFDPIRQLSNDQLFLVQSFYNSIDEVSKLFVEVVLATLNRSQLEFNEWLPSIMYEYSSSILDGDDGNNEKSTYKHEQQHPERKKAVLSRPVGIQSSLATRGVGRKHDFSTVTTRVSFKSWLNWMVLYSNRVDAIKSGRQLANNIISNSSPINLLVDTNQQQPLKQFNPPQPQQSQEVLNTNLMNSFASTSFVAPQVGTPSGGSGLLGNTTAAILGTGAILAAGYGTNKLYNQYINNHPSPQDANLIEFTLENLNVARTRVAEAIQKMLKK